MKLFLILILTCITLNLQAQTSEKAVNGFFKALKEKDIKTLDSITLDDLKLHSLKLQPKSPLSISTKDDFLQSLKAIPDNIDIEEQIFDMDSLVTEHLAQYTIPYKFFVNGELSHSGINVLTLIKIDNRWFISYIADTRQKQ